MGLETREERGNENAVIAPLYAFVTRYSVAFALTFALP